MEKVRAIMVLHRQTKRQRDKKIFSEQNYDDDMVLSGKRR